MLGNDLPETKEDTPRVDVPTWKFIWGIITFRGRYFLGNNIAFIIMILGWLVPGLITREFFNIITPGATARFDILSLLAILLASGMVRVLGVLGLVRTNAPFEYHNHALMHR